MIQLMGMAAAGRLCEHKSIDLEQKNLARAVAGVVPLGHVGPQRFARHCHFKQRTLCA